MLIGSPAGEARQIGEHLVRICVEDVWAVLVDQDPRLVRHVIGVAGDVRAAIDHQHPLAAVRRQPLGHDRAGEARADHNVVIM